MVENRQSVKLISPVRKSKYLLVILMQGHRVPPLVQVQNQGLCPMSSIRQKSYRPQAFGHWTLDIDTSDTF